METEVQVGQLIAGKYRVEQELGRGGMGVVMAALHTQLNQRVALKFLTESGCQQPEAVTRFLREARAAVQIQSEHVARVMDVGTLESGAPFMVMEYLRGHDLKAVSVQRGALPIVEAVDYVLQACDAVAEAHALGIVHRDLKPSNLFLTERADGSPLVKVLDFGISKALHGGEASQMQMTASAAIMGSPQYMSPEQIRSSKNVDARADVWALGVILHELLTGAPAYQADTVPGLLAMIVADSPPPLSRQRPDAPLELESCLLRCLQKDREQRFGSVAELARSLARFASAETQPLVRRIARILGDDAPPATVLTPETDTAPLDATVGGPTGQTNGSWTRTGSGAAAHTAGNILPLYRRPNVQIGAGIGAATLVLLAGVLFSRPSATTAGDLIGEGQAAASPTQGTVRPALAPSTPAAQPLEPPGPLVAPSVGVIVPPPSSKPPTPPLAERPSGDQDAIPGQTDPGAAEQAAREAKARAERKRARPTATKRKRATRKRPTSKKRSWTRKARSTTPPAKRASSPPPRATSEPIATKTTAKTQPSTSQKTNQLDQLFNDTK